MSKKLNEQGLSHLLLKLKSIFATKSSEHIHTNKSVLDTITQELVESWNNKTELMAEVSDDGILDLQF